VRIVHGDNLRRTAGIVKARFALSAPLLHEVVDAPVIGPFLFLGEIAGRQFVRGAVVGQALAADPVAGAPAIGAIAHSLVSGFILAFHGTMIPEIDAKRQHTILQLSDNFNPPGSYNEYHS
jgi:hypothetical protein